MRLIKTDRLAAVAFIGAVLLGSSILGFSLELPSHVIGGLGSAEFREREAVQSELLAWSRKQPEPAMTELLRQSQAAGDPEVRQRCLDVLRVLIMDEYSRDGEGFIGIAMKDEISDIPGETKPCRVIRVTEVRPDTPARQAGVQINDLIVRLNGQVWYDEDASLPFRTKIRKMKPNTKVDLKILRDGGLVHCNVTLARRPLLADRLFFNAQNFDPEASELAAKEAYFRRWLAERRLPK